MDKVGQASLPDIMRNFKMPYTMDNMPDSMKGAPKHAMEIFIAAFNSAFEKNHVEGAAMAIAMAAVHKAGYKKDEQGQWMSAGKDTEHRVPTMGNHAEWIPIFKTGTHTDSAGNEKTWTEAELDMIVQKYQSQDHEAPVVIGHPEHNSPAWGWVEGIKREGNILFGKFKDLIPEFVDMVRKGVFKKRSISLYPDMALRHVGFLGAMPPAVKGLPDVAFGDKEGITIDFGVNCNECKRCKTVNNFCGKAGAEDFQPLPRKEAKRMKWFDWMKKKAADEGVTIEDAPSFSESGRGAAPVPSQAEIQAQVNAEVAKVVGAKNAEFAETQKTLDAEKARLKAEHEKLEKAKGERMKDEIKTFCEGLCEKGKLTPAMMKYGMGMTNFLESISGIEMTYEFSEGSEKKTQTPVEYIKGLLGCFKKQIEFGEFAGNEKDFKAGGTAAEKLSLLTKKKMEDKKSLNYSQAFSEVQSENRELANEYAMEIGT